MERISKKFNVGDRVMLKKHAFCYRPEHYGRIAKIVSGCWGGNYAICFEGDLKPSYNYHGSVLNLVASSRLLEAKND